MIFRWLSRQIADLIEVTFRRDRWIRRFTASDHKRPVTVEDMIYPR